MTPDLLGLIAGLVSSPWLYLALFAVTTVDGFLPVAPGEAALVVVAVFAGSEQGSPAVLGAAILSGTFGALAGDHVAYWIGRGAIGRYGERLRRGERGRSLHDRVEELIARRGGQALLVSRYVPGVRTATTLCMGATRFPPGRFALFDVAAGLIWAGGWSLLGYLGGTVFADDPLTGLAVGLAAALVLGLASEAYRRRRRTPEHR